MALRFWNFIKTYLIFFSSHWVTSYADGEYRIPNPTLVKTRIPHPDKVMSHPQPCPVDVQNFQPCPGNVLRRRRIHNRSPWPSTQRLLHNSPVHRNQTRWHLAPTKGLLHSEKNRKPTTDHRPNHRTHHWFEWRINCNCDHHPTSKRKATNATSNRYQQMRSEPCFYKTVE